MGKKETLVIRDHITLVLRGPDGKIKDVRSSKPLSFRTRVLRKLRSLI